MAGAAMDEARHLCRFTMELSKRMPRFQALATSGFEAA